MKEEKICLPINPSIEADFRNGDKRSYTDQDRREKKYRQKKKADEESRRGKSEPKRYSDSSNSDGSDSSDDRSDKPDRKMGQSHRRKTKSRRWVSRRDRYSNPDGFSVDSSPALWKCSDQLSGRSNFDLDGDDRHQRRRRSNLRVVSPLNELFARAVGYRE